RYCVVLDNFNPLHSFRYRFGYQQLRVTCHTHGTVLDALRTSTEFKNTTKTRQGMEIVIQREKEPRAAVSTHFPCHLIDNDELLTVSFIRVLNGGSSDTQGLYKQSNTPKIQPDKLMTFCVETEGGQNIKTKAMKNPELRNKVKYVCVYGYKGERVKQALRRDGRFDKTVLKTGFVLSEPETSVDTEMSQLVDGLDGKSYQGRKGEMLIVKVKRIDGSSLVVKQKRQKIPNSKEILKEFGKKTQSFQEVKKVKRLIELSASVCQVRIEGNAQGTGFLLFEKLILTNAHVVHQIYEPITNKLQQSVTVTFDFEDLDERTQQIPVQSEVVAYGKVDSGCVDFALLELSSDPDITLPSSLLDSFSFPSLEGGICIIGHRGREKHVRENEEFLYVINNRYFEEKWDIGTHLPRDTEKITYDTCFFHGASGSPVFNEYCQLIAMHTAGYSYQGKRGKTQSVIEYAIPLSGILEEIIIQVVQAVEMFSV
uniref:Serine protease n=1 Tax=Oncorhynchus tshawytscha TaxID=74940 RepID=A0AAZ3SGH3_ONCTS